MKYNLDKIEMDLNLAPMIDVVFLLLIFFIVASSLNVKEVETTINLPNTGVISEVRNTEITIAITEKGEIYLRNKEIPLNLLKDYLQKELVGDKSQLSIYADKEVQFQNVINVIDIVQELKVDNLSFVLKRTNKH